MAPWPLLRKAMFQLDPERAHAVAHVALAGVGPRLARSLRPKVDPALRVAAFGLEFDGPLGLAAGFDKGEGHIAGPFALGFSHVEVGTITPRPQPGNDRPRLFRLPEHRALLNRMGFNNAGAEACARRLAALPAAARLGPVGVNVGKNKDTPNDRAVDDYLACIDRLHAAADYLVVNISSPNTPGLRQLQAREPLVGLLRACVARLAERAPGKQLLVKIAPDLAPEAMDEVVDVAVDVGAAGVIATNTTVSRHGIESHARAREAGGLSGAPLEPFATAAVRRCYARAGGRLLVVGCGGILSAADAWAKIRAGATLVQGYTGLIYEGPSYARAIHDGLAALLRRDGFVRLADAVGADHRSGS